MKSKPKLGITILETVVALSIVLFLVSVFTPQILNSRQRVRIAECANNLRWTGQAWLMHESAQGHLPSSGWGWRWTGDPNRGFGRNQPGGWAFNMVRFTEHEASADLAAGVSSDRRIDAMLQTHGTPIPQFYCPDRRPVRAYPLSRNGFLANNLPECAPGRCNVVRIDYQANSGNMALGETGGPGASTMDPPDPYTRDANGATGHVSETRLAEIEDGLTKTLMVGEKYLNVDAYFTGSDAGDDGSAYVGIDRDVNGYTASWTGNVVSSNYLPRRDRSGLQFNWAFGSPHPVGFNTVNCDGSVRFVAYDIDPFVFYLLGGRNDGQAMSP